jgi:hypothetical protein
MFTEKLSVSVRVQSLRCQDFLVTNETDSLMEGVLDFNVEELNEFLNYLKSMHCKYLEYLQEVENFLEPLTKDEPLFEYCQVCDLRKNGECKHPLFKQDANVCRVHLNPCEVKSKLEDYIQNDPKRKVTSEKLKSNKE